MALVKAEALQGLNELPMLRQLGVMVGLAASVAIGVAVVLWSQQPDYRLLYANLSEADNARVMEALNAAKVDYELDGGSGAILVPAEDVHRVRLQLAAEGLPQTGEQGFGILREDQGFGTSQFMEGARYQHALEQELATTIASLQGVQAARVHLALPKRSAFMRKTEAPSASVTLHLGAGAALLPSQAKAIANLVAASVPRLHPKRVTIVDQEGELLSGTEPQPLGLTEQQFDYRRKVEASYAERVQDLLEALVGRGRVRAEVSAELDFTQTESTSEIYNPEQPVLRSEQLQEELRVGGAGDLPAGIPGTLTNQPPGGAVAPEQALAGAQGDGGEGGDADGEAPLRDRRSAATRNYEIDRTVNHVRRPFGVLSRLSVAVVLDNKPVVVGDGGGDAGADADAAAWSEAELANLRQLVEGVVGFDDARGDRISIVNVPFRIVDEPETLPVGPAWWQSPLLMQLGKNLAAALVVLVLIFSVLRPLMRGLVGHAPAVALPEGAGAAEAGGESAEALSGPQGQGQLESPEIRFDAGNSYEQQLNAAKGLVQQDPKRVAQVVRGWVNAEKE